MRPTPRALLTIAAFLSVACSTGGDEKLQVTRDTLPNGAVSIHYAALPVATDTLTPNLTIGALHGEPHETFGDIRAIEVDTDGRIYVLDYQAAEVRAFDSSGTYLRTLTRSGRGPGEIVNANGMILSPDGTLWIQDHAQWTIIGVDLEGNEVARFPMPIRAYGYMWDAVLDEQGRFWQQTSHSDEEPAFPPKLGVNEGSSRTYQKWFKPADQATDSVFIGVGSGRWYVSRTSDGGWRHSSIPLDAQGAMIADPAGGFWTTRGDAWRVERLDERGDTIMVLEVDVPPAAVTDEDRQRVIDSHLENSPGSRAVAEEIVSLMPATKPVLDQLVLDDEGNLWARRYGDADDFPYYDVFSRDGTYLGSVVLATRVSRFLRPRIVRGSIYTLALDDMDVPSVVRAAPDVLPSGDGRRGMRVAAP